MTIDWSKYESVPSESSPVVLREVAIGVEVPVTFSQVKEVSNGGLLAVVETELEGDFLWLSSSEYGPQNGFMSLVKAANGGENIEGKTFTFSRIESEKSPAGYAYRWTA